MLSICPAVKKGMPMLVIAVVLAAMITLPACTGESKAPESDNAAVAPNELPYPVRSLTVTLPYEAGSGYWACDSSDTGKIALVKVEASDFSDDDASDGKEVLDAFAFAGRDAGTARLSFSFNDDGVYDASDEIFYYEVSVADDKTVEVTGFEGDESYKDAFVVNG